MPPARLPPPRRPASLQPPVVFTAYDCTHGQSGAAHSQVSDQARRGGHRACQRMHGKVVWARGAVTGRYRADSKRTATRISHNRQGPHGRGQTRHANASRHQRGGRWPTGLGRPASSRNRARHAALAAHGPGKNYLGVVGRRGVAARSVWPSRSRSFGELALRRADKRLTHSVHAISSIGTHPAANAQTSAPSRFQGWFGSAGQPDASDPFTVGCQSPLRLPNPPSHAAVFCE